MTIETTVTLPTARPRGILLIGGWLLALGALIAGWRLATPGWGWTWYGTGYIVVASLLSLTAGAGVLARKPWARILAIIDCVFTCPVGMYVGFPLVAFFATRLAGPIFSAQAPDAARQIVGLLTVVVSFGPQASILLYLTTPRIAAVFAGEQA